MLATSAGSTLPAHAAADESVEASICRLIETSAQKHGLPVLFFTRLIWKESNFRADAISPVGASGIAQFMPGTAAERGLANPFDPEEAIPKSAELLVDLKKQFGNLGLAAAAYNAGPRRVANWLAGTAGLPAETRDYVAVITRHPAEDWRDGADAQIDEEKLFPPQTCLQAMVGVRRAGPLQFAGTRALSPWGVQLAGNFSKSIALATYQRARTTHPQLLAGLEPMIIGRRLRSRGAAIYYQVRTPAATRAAALALCDRINRVGGACLVLKS